MFIFTLRISLSETDQLKTLNLKLKTPVFLAGVIPGTITPASYQSAL
jgi:hypothetical protein